MLNLHLQAESPARLLSLLLDLTSSVALLERVNGAQVPTPSIALFSDEELQDELARREAPRGGATLVVGDGSAPLPGDLLPPGPAPKDSPTPKRGRPAKPKPTAVNEAQLPLPDMGVEGEQPPAPDAIPAGEPALPDMGLGDGVAVSAPDRGEMERALSALFSRGRSMEQVRELMVQQTGAATLGKAPKESWPKLLACITQELKNIEARVI